MTDHGRRYKSYFQFARNTAGNYGADAAATHRIPVLNFTRGVTRDRRRSSVQDGSRFKQSVYQSNKWVRPSLECELYYNSAGLLLLDTLMGTATFGSNGGTTTGANPYTHVLKMREIFNSLVGEWGAGDIPAGQVEQFLGLKMQRGVLSGRVGEALKLRFDFLGQDHSFDVTPTSIGGYVAPTDCVRFGDLFSFNDGTGTVGNLLGFELTIENMLSERARGSDLVDEPIASGQAACSLRIEEEFQTNSAAEAHVAGTEGAPDLYFKSGTKEFRIQMPKAHIDENPEPEGDDRMMQNLLWVPIGDDGSPETYATITVVNAQATITS